MEIARVLDLLGGCDERDVAGDERGCDGCAGGCDNRLLSILASCSLPSKTSMFWFMEVMMMFCCSMRSVAVSRSRRKADSNL